MNYVLRYIVSDTDSLRPVHLFMWPEPYDAARETRQDSFSPQDLPAEAARARIDEFLAAATAQAGGPEPVAATAAAQAAERLRALSRAAR